MMRVSIRLGLLAALIVSVTASNTAPAGADPEPTAAWCTDVVTYDFIQVPVGSSREADIFFSSCGDVAANVSGFSFSGPHAGDYALVSNTCIDMPVQPGSYCGVRVRFSPSATGTRDAVLTVASDALPTELPVLLTGQGLATSDLTVVATSRAVVASGHDLVINVVVQNLGPDTAPSVSVGGFLPGQFRSVTATAGVTCGTPPPDFETGFIGCDLGLLAGGASKTLQVRITVLAHAPLMTVTEWTTVAPGSFDPDLANNTFRQDIRVVGKP